MLVHLALPYGWGSCLGFVGFVDRVLFPCVLWSMLSGPRHLLLALALGMCVGPFLWIRRSCLSFVLSPLFALLAVSLFLLFCPLILVCSFLGSI